MGQRHRFTHRVRWASAGALVAAGAVLAGTVLASAAAPTLPRRTPAQILLAMRHAKLPRALSAVITQSTNLGFPALPDIAGLSSSVLSAASLVSGTHTVEIWYSGPTHIRIALPVSFGETDLRVNGNQIWLWDSHSQTATRYIVPVPGHARSFVMPDGGPVPGSKPLQGSRPLPMPGVMPMHGLQGPFAGLTPVQAVNRLLAMVGRTTKVTVDGTVMVAGQPAYQLAIAPRSGQSLIGRILIAVDAASYLPLQVQVFARGSSSPAFQTGFTSFIVGQPAMSNFTFTPPPGAHVKISKLPLSLPAVAPLLPGGMRIIGLPSGKQLLLPLPCTTGVIGRPVLHVALPAMPKAVRLRLFKRLVMHCRPGEIPLPSSMRVAFPCIAIAGVVMRPGEHLALPAAGRPVRQQASQRFVMRCVPGIARPGLGKQVAVRGIAGTPVPVPVAGPLAGVQVLGRGWLSVAVIPAGKALAAVSGGHWRAFAGPVPTVAKSVAVSGGNGKVTYQPGGRFAGPPASAQVMGLIQVLLNAATRVHGSWGSGRLLRTSLFSVLITSKGQVLVGAVTPTVLYADAAKVK